MREFLTESEKVYIRSNILQPMESDLSKSALFNTIERALLMLNSSLSRLKFDRKQYQAKFICDRPSEKDLMIRLLAKHIDCDEVISLDLQFKLP